MRQAAGPQEKVGPEAASEENGVASQAAGEVSPVLDPNGGGEVQLLDLSREEDEEDGVAFPPPRKRRRRMLRITAIVTAFAVAVCGIFYAVMRKRSSGTESGTASGGLPEGIIPPG